MWSELPSLGAETEKSMIIVKIFKKSMKIMEYSNAKALNYSKAKV
jgi:hypothetical protein